MNSGLRRGARRANMVDDSLAPHDSERTEQIPVTVRNPAAEVQNATGQMASDAAMDGAEQIVATMPNARGRATRVGRKVTINDKLRKKRARGEQLDIAFPQPFGKVCGKHAKIFKSEISVIVRTKVPLQAKRWKDVEELHPGTMDVVWRELKNKFPELRDQDKDYAMKQVEEQYTNRRYRLRKLFSAKKPRPTHASPDDWEWLIRNVWTDDDFLKRSKQNSANRSKQEMGSKVGTKSIAQIAYELRNKETGQWPTAMEVWKATYQKANGTWSIPNGEEIMTQLNEAAHTHQNRISSAPIPLVEHFALVLGKKTNHSRGVGFRAVNGVAEERLRLQAQIQAAERAAAAAQERANAAEERAEAMETQVRIIGEANTRLYEEQQSQRVELNSQRTTVEGQSAEVTRLVQQQVQQEMATFWARMTSGVPPSQSPSAGSTEQNVTTEDH